jgi:hypothetical protein
MLELVTSTSDEPVATTPLFSIDGREYSIPTVVPPSVGLRYLKMLRTQGELIANGWVLEEMLGTEAYEALSEFKGLTNAHLMQLTEVVGKHVLGSLEEPERAAAVGKASLRPVPTRSAGRSTTRRTSKRTS